jgi:hypothetical protein
MLDHLSEADDDLKNSYKGATTFSITTFSMTTLSTMTRSTKDLFQFFVTLSINDTQHNSF